MSGFSKRLGVALVLLSVANGAAQVKNGVQSGPRPAAPGAPETRGASFPGHIDFDDATASCTFAATVALTTGYAGIGAVFSGPGGLDGGAILDQCGNFGVSGYSPPNFLAFNLGATLSNGGIPQGPETVVFSQAVDTVSVNAGHGSAGNITLECFASGGGSVGQQTIVGNPTLQPLSVSAAGQIARCRFSFTGGEAVFDDLSWDPPVPVELMQFRVE